MEPASIYDSEMEISCRLVSTQLTFWTPKKMVRVGPLFLLRLICGGIN